MDPELQLIMQQLHKSETNTSASQEEPKNYTSTGRDKMESNIPKMSTGQEQLKNNVHAIRANHTELKKNVLDKQLKGIITANSGPRTLQEVQQ
jgi:protein required for attachment to host cells